MESAFRLLSACFCEPELDVWESEELTERLAESLESFSPEAAGHARKLRDHLDGEDELPLRVRYAELFVGPHSLVAPPYGSVYLDPGGRVMGESTRAVAERYRAAGLEVDGELNEPPDHIALELEFVSRLYGSGRAGEAERFLSEFVAPWVPAFCVRVRAGARGGVYESLASCLEAAVTEVADRSACH